MASKLGDDNIPPSAKTQVPGYPGLASKMGANPQHAILRRFFALSTQNLLYYQAELVYLEDRLREAEARSWAKGDGTKQYQFARDWDELKRSWKFKEVHHWEEKDEGIAIKSRLCPCEGNSAGILHIHDISKGTDGEQLRLVLRLRSTLKRYNKAVLQQFSMSNLPQPGAQDLHHLQQWLRDPKGGDFSLDGIDSDVWESSPDDLFALRGRPDTDKLSEWVVNHLLPSYHKHIGRLFKKPNPDGDNSVTYTENYCVSAFVTVLSSAFIVVPVVVLHTVKSINTRLGLLALFTVLFSLCVSALTNARRGEVFVATATFAAVQVVFIGTSGSSS